MYASVSTYGAAPRPSADPVDLPPAESLARIDCGPQELRERLAFFDQQRG